MVIQPSYSDSTMVIRPAQSDSAKVIQRLSYSESAMVIRPSYSDSAKAAVLFGFGQGDSAIPFGLGHPDRRRFERDNDEPS